MQRFVMTPRADWVNRADELGFAHHSPDGEPYWDESASYCFTLGQVEEHIEAATRELWDLCLESVDRFVRDERALERMKIPRHAWPLIAESWREREPTLYGRFDLAYNGKGPPKLLEFNADTPIRRPPFTRLRFSSGTGWKTGANAAFSRSAPTSSIRCTKS